MSDIIIHDGINIGGINSLQFAYISDVESIAYHESNRSAEVTLKAGKAWNFLYGTLGTITLKSKEEPSPAGTIFKYDLELLIPKDRDDVEFEMITLEGQPVIIKALNKNGTCRLFGDISNPMRKSGELLWPGNLEDFNGYKVTFSGSFSTPAYYILGEDGNGFIEPGGGN